MFRNTELVNDGTSTIHDVKTFVYKFTDDLFDPSKDRKYNNKYDKYTGFVSLQKT